jgi:hydrogenase maturation protein HypF
VQGVGFRPYVFRLASELGLDGWVLNDSAGVVVEVEAAPASVDRFFARLATDAPPLASVERVAAETLAPAGLHGFEIRPSPVEGEPNAAVTPDGATCDDCLRELFDPADRRYRYPFINCTNCGPRFTIVRGVPYDRPNTTMAAFEMCPACRAEYENPADRRFHAQPNACPACGPRLRVVTVDAADRLAAEGDAADPLAAADDAADPLASAAMALRAGAIVAVKGIGGFHLACRADDENAVATLRSRKHREDKPFALMVADAGVARSLVDLRHEDEALLRSRMRPIVLAPRLPEADVAPSVAPASRELGLMLPYSPLHHLLRAACGTPLVMTSGNVSDEPIAFHDDDALERLSRIADLFLLHDRPIHTRTDDSVVRTVGRRTMVLRRSRGYVPDALKLPIAAPRAIVACGAEQKNTFCVAKGDRAWVGHHVGDLENWETLRSFTHGIDHFERLFAVEPTVVAHDLHPEYLSTKYALARDGLEAIGVQHHHAHLAACLAEHGELGTAVGAIFDGTGYGTDGTIWGGELLFGDIARAERAGMLWPVRMPGGAAAIREPWRMACAWLDAAGLDADAPPAEMAGQVPRKRWREIRDLARAEVASPVTSSAGRLFDAVAALCGIRPFVNYEGQAAVELEAACDPAELEHYEVALLQRHGRLVVDVRPAISAIAGDLARGTAVAAVAARFHNTIAAAVANSCAVVARRYRTRTVVLSGGVFQNRRLLEDAAQRLNAAGLRTLIPERLPVNDGGISYGQAVVAAARLARGEADGRS